MIKDKLLETAIELLKKIPSLFGSRRFWAFVVGMMITSYKDDLGLSPEQMEKMTNLIVGWIIADSLYKTKLGG